MASAVRIAGAEDPLHEDGNGGEGVGCEGRRGGSGTATHDTPGQPHEAADMARTGGTVPRQRTNECGELPATTEAECRLLLLPPAVLGLIWPAARVVVGLRVGKQLRRDLIAHCTRILLVQKVETKSSDFRISHDLRRLPESLTVTLKWKGSNGMKTLAEALGKCKALAHLDLSNTNIGSEGVQMLMGVLGECKALAHLDLSKNAICHAGAGSLAGVLGRYKALTHLDLSANLIIGAEGARSLAEVLGGCTALAHLNLSGISISDATAGKLARVLGECKALTHLDLHLNEIGCEGAKSLARVLGECNALARAEVVDSFVLEKNLRPHPHSQHLVWLVLPRRCIDGACKQLLHVGRDEELRQRFSLS